MIVAVRPLRKGEGRLFLQMHGRSIRGLAAGHYPPAVLDAWTVPLTEDRLRSFEDNRDGETRLIAEIDGKPVGLGALVVKNSELRACYVVPEAARNAVRFVWLSTVDDAVEAALEPLASAAQRPDRPSTRAASR